jgi:hypothetical protein
MRRLWRQAGAARRVIANSGDLSFLGSEVRCTECQHVLLVLNDKGQWVANEKDRRHAEGCGFAARLAEVMMRNEAFVKRLRSSRS